METGCYTAQNEESEAFSKGYVSQRHLLQGREKYSPKADAANIRCRRILQKNKEKIQCSIAATHDEGKGAQALPE